MGRKPRTFYIFTIASMPWLGRYVPVDRGEWTWTCSLSTRHVRRCDAIKIVFFDCPISLYRLHGDISQEIYCRAWNMSRPPWETSPSYNKLPADQFLSFNFWAIMVFNWAPCGKLTHSFYSHILILGDCAHYNCGTSWYLQLRTIFAVHGNTAKYFAL